MNNNFAENLKRIRKENNLSQEQLAEELGVSRQAISKWESQVAYPEMDKIIALCNKFNLNIDDLLNKDIREVKGEEESKKNINKHIDDFLKFITDTINLFANMNLKSKIKCLFEQFIVILVLMLLGLVIYSFGDYVFHSVIWMLPEKIFLVVNSLLESLLAVLLVVVAIVIFIHIFKTRYLDYYEKLKQEVVKEEKIMDEQKEEVESTSRVNKILFKKNENKIIIRDPKHSEYRFVNGLFKFIVAIIKAFVLSAILLLCLLLVLFAGLFIITFLVYKTGLFFLGLTGISISLMIIDIILILLLFNFVFNRKNEKKKMIWFFIASLVLLGTSLGSIFIGVLDFKIIEEPTEYLKTESIEFDMEKNLFFDVYLDVEYIESNIDNVKVEYTINEYFDVSSVYYGTGEKHLWTYCSNPLGMIKRIIDDLNNKKISNIDDGYYLEKLKVYASKENIKILKKNFEEYHSMQKNYENQIEEYTNTINEYSMKISILEDKIARYEDELNMYHSNEE